MKKINMFYDSDGGSGSGVDTIMEYAEVERACGEIDKSISAIESACANPIHVVNYEGSAQGAIDKWIAQLKDGLATMNEDLSNIRKNVDNARQAYLDAEKKLQSELDKVIKPGVTGSSGGISRNSSYDMKS